MRLRLILVTGSITTLAFTPSGLDAFSLVKLIALMIGSTAVLAYHISKVKQPRGDNPQSKFRISASENFIILLAGLILLSSLTNLENPYRFALGAPGRYNGVIYYFCILFLVWVLATCNLDKKFLKNFEWTLGGTGLVVVIYSWIQFFGIDFVDWDNPYNRIIGTFGNPNFSAAFLASFSIFCLSKTIWSSDRDRLVWLFLSILSTPVALLAESIQGNLIVVFGAFLALFVSLKNRLTKLSRISAILVMGFVALLTLFSMFGFGPIAQYLEQYTLRLRFFYWETAVRTANANPLNGIGSDSYSVGYRLYRPQEFGDSFNPRTYSDSAHNIFLNVLANYGYVTFAVMVLLFALALKKILARVLLAQEKSNEINAISLFFVMMVTQAIFSIEQIGLTVFLWLALGIILNKSFENDLAINRKSKMYNENSKAYLPILLLALLSLTIYPAQNLIRENLQAKRVADLFASTSNLANSDYAGIARNELMKTGHYTNSDPRLAVKIAQYWLLLGDKSKALQLLNNLIGKNPSAVEPLELRSLYYEEVGEIKSAIIDRESFLQLDPSNIDNLYALARLYFQDGSKSRGKFFASEILRLNPDSELALQAQALLDSGN
jgi:O-antigen ligase